jgi:NADPH:quinone reductase-like Zn-dependent oxidoreductase
MDASLDLFVRQDDPRRHRWVETPAPALRDGDALVRVEKFGLSANNVTYAVLGKSPIINYSDFFPTGEDGWGRVPVWGMGVVEASKGASVAAGERMYGYFPLARSVVLRPATKTALGFNVDRGPLPDVYNQYTLTRSDPFHLPGREEAMLVFRPLVLTGILLDDFIADGNDWFGAGSVLIASASSKTSIGLAAMLAKRPGHEVVGLTSARHAAFVKSLGFYSRVVTYDAIGEIAPGAAAVLVDVAGDARVRQALENHLGANLKATITVGLSHWDHAADLTAPSPTSVFFFAPGWMAKRRDEWGAAELGRRVAGAWHEFMRDVDRWVHVVTGAGRDVVAATYDRMVAGDCGPDEAHVLSLCDGAFKA